MRKQVAGQCIAYIATIFVDSDKGKGFAAKHAVIFGFVVKTSSIVHNCKRKGSSGKDGIPLYFTEIFMLAAAWLLVSHTVTVAHFSAHRTQVGFQIGPHNVWSLK